MAAVVRGHIDRIEHRLAFAVARGVAGAAGEELDPVRGLRIAVQRSGDHTAGGDCFQHGEILTLVGPPVPIAEVVGIDPGRAQVDTQTCVGVEGIGQDGGANTGFHGNTVSLVEGNGISRPGYTSADGVFVRRADDEHAGTAVAQIDCAGGIRADEVALHPGQPRAANDGHAALVPVAIARDDIPGSGGYTPDQSAGGSLLYGHADHVILHSSCSIRIGADEVALHSIVVPTNDIDTGKPVSRDDIPGSGGCAADRVVGAAEDLDPAPAIAQLLGAAHIRADVVPLHDISIGVSYPDAWPLVARDDIACPGRRPADRVALGPGMDRNAHSRISQRGRPRRIRADEVAFDPVPRRPFSVDLDPRPIIDRARDEVSRPGCRPADHVVGAVDDDSAATIAQPPSSTHIGTDIVALDGGAGAQQPDACPLEPVDHQAPHGRAVGRNNQTARISRIGAVQFHDRCPRIRRRRGAVEDNRVLDPGQPAQRPDRVRSGAGNLEHDGVRAGPGIGVEQGLTQGSCAAVAGMGHR